MIMADESSSEALRRVNPGFARLVDVISGVYHEDGMPKSTKQQLVQAELKLKSAKQQYLEQLLFTEELREVVKTETRSSGADSATTRSHDMLSLITATAELQHCLDVGMEGVSLLGLQPEHLRAVLEGARRSRASKQAVRDCLEERLKAKCCRLARWQAPAREAESDSSLELARAKQLPQLLTQQREEVEKFREEAMAAQRECRELRARRHKVQSGMCVDLGACLEHSKLEMVANANRSSLNYFQAQAQAMLGKLDVMHHRLLKDISIDGRVQALEQIRSHLLSAQQQLREELAQTQQVIHNYHSLGEEFALLTQQYRKLREEIENRQWALTELGKPRANKR